MGGGDFDANPLTFSMSELAYMTAAILAGGLGTRLSSAVPGKPKVLAEVGGRPFIEYLLDQLRRAGARSVVLCTGYLGDQVEASLGENYQGITLSYSRETKPLGTGGALRLALPMLDSNTVLVLNGDSYFAARLDSCARWHIERQSQATILLAEEEDTRRFGRVDFDGNGQILQFREKTETRGKGWVNAGIYFLQRDLIETIPAHRAVSLEREVFPHWIRRGLNCFCSPGRLWDIGVPEAYKEANAEFSSAILDGSQ